MMSEKLTKIINLLLTGGINLLFFLIPLFFLPLTYEFYEFNKNIILVFFSLILTLLWVIKSIFEKRIYFKKTFLDLPVISFAFIFILSNILISFNKLETFLTINSTGTIISLTLLFFLITNNIKVDKINRLITLFILSGTIVSLITIFEVIGLITLLPVPEWAKSSSFTPAGATLSLLTLLIPIFILNLTVLFSKIKERAQKPIFLHGLGFVFLVLGILLTGRQLMLTPPVLLSQNDGWAISIETLKQYPLLGVGPNDFLSAFSRFRLLGFNQSNLWSIRFGVSSNWYFQLITTVGILGFGAFFWLIWRVINYWKQNRLLNEKVIALASLLILLALVPVNYLLLFSLYFLIAITALHGPVSELEERSALLPWLLFFPILVLSAGGIYLFGKSWLGDYYFRKSLVAYTQNNGIGTYNWQIKAISFTPYNSNYRLSYSQTNLALANALAGKEDLTDQDRQNISVLIQQAIQEAKTAAALNPQSVIGWENLAITYRSLINFAQGAENWTTAAYQQAISLDPLNPNLRVALGGVYYALQDWENAQRQFEIATQLKPNYANAHYNLSAAYRDQGKLDRAVAAMQTVVSLVPIDSQDYQKAQSEFEALQQKLTETARKESAQPSETLKPPEPTPAGIKPPLTLPTSAAPEISPIPTAVPSAPPPTPTP